MILPPLLILRHGQTVSNRDGLMQGNLDSPLTPLGIAQAQAQNKILRRVRTDSFTALTSPQGRAVHTAVLALRGIVDDIPTDSRLREIGVGDWAGQGFAAITAQARSTDPMIYYQAAPNGEGFDALRYRCHDFLRDLTGPTIVVTHGVTLRMLCCAALDLPITRLFDLTDVQGVVTKIKGGELEILS